MSRGKRRLPPPLPKEKPGEGRAQQRKVCLRLLERWVPVATAEAVALGKEGTVLDEEALEAGFKAGAFVLKVLERLARLDGLDAAEKKELTVAQVADPAELARRVEAVSPALMARLRLGDLTRE